MSQNSRRNIGMKIIIKDYKSKCGTKTVAIDKAYGIMIQYARSCFNVKIDGKDTVKPLHMLLRVIN